MALATVRSVALHGIEGQVIEVEAFICSGLPSFHVVGLPDATVNEARDRVRAAIVNAREPWPQMKVTVGLSPAGVRKAGSAFDLAIATAVLLAHDRVPPDVVRNAALLGELSLDGRVRPIAGVLPSVLAAVRSGIERVLVPASAAAEARLVPGADVTGITTLTQLIALMRGEDDPEPVPGEPVDDVGTAEPERPGPDLAQVVGQQEGRRAVEIAAAGGHHLLFVGSPGCGKTMLAERLPGLLPPLSTDDALEVSAIHSVAGALPAGRPLLRRPPFRAPHHTASTAALVGGGSAVIRPGAASLAHRGVLFLDEAAEFASGTLDALRQPLESGHIVIDRAAARASFPARFTLVLASNPCPCARTSGQGDVACECTSAVRRRYLGKLSGPLLDRVDLRVRLLPVSRADLLDGTVRGEPSELVAARVLAARHRASTRLRGTPWTSWGEVPGTEVRQHWHPPHAAMGPLNHEADRGRISARGMDRVFRVAWTLADLDGCDVPEERHVKEAVELRQGLA
jgi:magnesium chelatase family protein